MRPVLLDITCFRGWKQRTEIPLEATITVVVAENRRGKSSTTNALEWCLFGSKIAKAGSGIDERQKWEIHPRGAGDQPTRVRLVFKADDGRYELVRCRNPNAGLREPDELSITYPDGTRLSDASAVEWVEDQLPGWDTYRRAHCFHQEAARIRVIDSADRSAILAGLLGLEAEIELQDNLKACKPTEIIKTIDETLDDLTAEVKRSLDRPLREVFEIEKRLEAKGIQRIAINEDLAVDVRQRLLESARTLAQRLAMSAELPEETDATAVQRWTTLWPTAARQEAPALKDLEQKRGRRVELANAISTATTQDANRALKHKDVEVAIKEGGDLDAREMALTSASEGHAAAADALRQADARLALFQDVKQILDNSGNTQDCPVCESPVLGLAERVDTEIDALQTAELAKLNAGIEESRRDEAAAGSSLEELQQLIEAERKARNTRNEARAALRTMLGNPSEAEVHDVVAMANKRKEELDREIEALDNLANERDESLRLHEQDSELLADIDRLFAARQRAATQVDLSTMDSWQELNKAIDRAAGFACDLEALAQMARTMQADHSKERVSQVNEALGKYYQLITGEADSGRICVKTKRTARKLAYELVDHAGNQAVPVLNQASINALSLALLFAQAEAQADSDGLQYIVLDDPIQSLDAEHQAGLARAIEALPSHLGVMLGVIESPLVDRLKDYVAVSRQMIMLGKYSPEKGSQIASQESL